ncbi:MAG: ferritin-like domain-containing protein [Geminicoccaceae bacterium]
MQFVGAGSERTGVSRRGLLGAGAAAAALAAAGPAGAAVGDADILNFALNLEYLEAEFYLRAAFGRGLDDGQTGGTGTRGAVTGGRQVPFASRLIREYAQEIARDEAAHVRFLRRTLGAAAVARPRIDLRASFTNAARAAGLVGPGESFDPFASEDGFLLGAFVFEDVGVTAYKGAATLIAAKPVLDAAAGILAVEAYHAGEIRTLLRARGLVAQARKISDLRDAADGRGDKDRGVVDANWEADIVPTDGNGLAFGRSASQVLDIVYLGGAAAGFGFFPARLNGAIR